jgi:SAM-dependent methyltransferase
LTEDAAVSEPAFVTKTRASFDAVAADYAARFADELAGRPLDRALLAAFAECVPAGPVADVGCGPGHVTAHLASLGLEVCGIDLSPGMVEEGRVRHGTEWLGHPVDLHVYRNRPDVVAGLLAEAGLAVRATMVREPDDDGGEIGPRAYLLATPLCQDQPDALPSGRS